VKSRILVAVLMTLAGGHVASAQTLPAGNAAAGQRVFNQCASCHTIGKGAQAEAAPVLNGVVGRKAGSAPGYDYSAALKNSGLTWDVPTLARFLQAPAKTVPGSQMAFGGLAKPQDQADVIAYLRQFAADGTKK
jgi:cytochrome c